MDACVRALLVDGVGYVGRSGRRVVVRLDGGGVVWLVVVGGWRDSRGGRITCRKRPALSLYGDFIFRLRKTKLPVATTRPLLFFVLFCFVSFTPLLSFPLRPGDYHPRQRDDEATWGLGYGSTRASTHTCAQRRALTGYNSIEHKLARSSVPSSRRVSGRWAGRGTTGTRRQRGGKEAAKRRREEDAHLARALDLAAALLHFLSRAVFGSSPLVTPDAVAPAVAPTTAAVACAPPASTTLHHLTRGGLGSWRASGHALGRGRVSRSAVEVGVEPSTGALDRRAT
jgi:hypothetical protein